MLTQKVQSCVEGNPGFKINRNLQGQEYMDKQTPKRSAASSVDCGWYPDQIIVESKDEDQRNSLLLLINARIKHFKDIINQLFIPPDRGLDRYCDCFEACFHCNLFDCDCYDSTEDDTSE